MDKEMKIALKYNKGNICRLPFIENTKTKQEDLISGINYIDAEYWEEAKKHKMVKVKLDTSIIEEINVEEASIKKTVTVEEVVKDKDGKEKKKKVTKEKTEKINVTDFSKLTPDEKKSLIEETYKIDSLEKFKNESINDAEIRYIIEKRIDEIKNAKTDDTIDHPKGHLKTS